VGALMSVQVRHLEILELIIILNLKTVINHYSVRKMIFNDTSRLL